MHGTKLNEMTKQDRKKIKRLRQSQGMGGFNE